MRRADDVPKTLATVAWALAAVALEVALYRSYSGHDAAFHWYTHFFVGAGAALVVMTVVARVRRRPVRLPLLWMLVGHLYAMVPDLLFTGGHVAHQRWMDVFAFHVSSHFVPGRNLTWCVVFLGCLAMYLGTLDRLRPPAASGLYAETWGEGPPVLFLHGLGASSRYWGPLAEEGGHYRGIAPDLLGFGRSPRRRGPYDTAAHVAAIEPLLREGAVVVGHSTGAILAAALARAHPERVRALLLVGLPAFPDEATARTEIARLGLLARLTVKDSVAARLVCGAMCALRPLLVPLAPRLNHDLAPEIAADFLRHSWTSYSGTLLHVVVGHRVEPDLVAARRPVVLVGGRADRDAPVSYLLAFVAELDAAQVPAELVVADGGHNLAVHGPALVARLLGDVLGGRRPRPAQLSTMAGAANPTDFPPSGRATLTDNP